MKDWPQSHGSAAGPGPGMEWMEHIPFFLLSTSTHRLAAAPVSLGQNLDDGVLVLLLLEVCVGMLQLAPIKKG